MLNDRHNPLEAWHSSDITLINLLAITVFFAPLLLKIDTTIIIKIQIITEGSGCLYYSINSAVFQFTDWVSISICLRFVSFFVTFKGRYRLHLWNWLANTIFNTEQKLLFRLRLSFKQQELNLVSNWFNWLGWAMEKLVSV